MTDLLDTLQHDLQQLQGEHYLDPLTRQIYATDASHYQQTPQCVVIPKNREDILSALHIAHAHQLPVTARGGGTSLSGQTFGPGMVIDTTKYCNRILEINHDAHYARVEPGVIRDELNRKLSEHGLHFAPDPATGSRASIGGMIGNNTSGTRSIVYGKTIDHVLGCTVALYDGTVIECTDLNRDEWIQKSHEDKRGSHLYKGIADLVQKHAHKINQVFPRVLRRVSGYNLDEFVDGAGYIGSIGPRGDRSLPNRSWNMSNLIVGSEGTLGFLLDATVRLTPLPHATSLCIVHYDDGIEALRSTPVINSFNPSAVELLDDIVLDEARINPATKELSHFIEGSPKAILIVEFFGDTTDEALQSAQALAAKLAQQGCGYAWPICTDPLSQQQVWDVRKLGLGLISNTPGPCKGQAFVEDACVPVEHLAGYIEKLQTKCDQRDVKHSMYAHASVGVIHFRPMLDLHLAEDRQKMSEIADFSFKECTKLGGTVAGEHGDGIVRGQFIEQAFGSDLYQAFKDLKKIFDPDNRLNPGKLIDPPGLTDSHYLRYGDHYHTSTYSSTFQFADQVDMQLAVEQCNGVGACRKRDVGTMCPSYMATGDEAHSTRGRANALRMALSGQLGVPAFEALASDELHDVLSLCLSCKACASECPNGVDMAKLKSEALHARHSDIGIPLSAHLIGAVPDIVRNHPFLLRFHDWLQKIPGIPKVFEAVVGFDARRPLPNWSRRSLADLYQAQPSSSSRRVGLFVDTYTGYMEPKLGLLTIQLLKKAGWHVDLLHAGCCQRTRISQGLLDQAQEHGLHTLAKLDAYADQETKIIILEPSCASSLTHDLPDLVSDPALARRVSQRVISIENFIHHHDIPVRSRYEKISMHTHCHQRSVGNCSGLQNTVHADIESIQAGCCGMAGAFGYQHYDLSMQVAEDRFFPAIRQASHDGRRVIANGISCRHQIKDGLDIQALHWIETVEYAD